MVLRGHKFAPQLAILKWQKRLNLVFLAIDIKFLNLLIEDLIEIDHNVLLVDYFADLFLLFCQDASQLFVNFLRDAFFVLKDQVDVIRLLFVQFLDLQKTALAIFRINVRKQILAKLLKYCMQISDHTMLVLAQPFLQTLSQLEMFLNIPNTLPIILITFDPMVIMSERTLFAFTDEPGVPTARVIAYRHGFLIVFFAFWVVSAQIQKIIHHLI